MVTKNLYVVLKNIQTITYEWTSDKLHVEADESSGSYVRGGALGDAPVLSSTTPAHATRPRHTMPASCEVFIGIPI